MSFWVLTPSCKVVSRTSVQRVTQLEMGEEATWKRTAAFDETIKLRLRDHAHTLEEDGKVEPFDWSTHPFSDDPDFQEEFNSITSNEEVKDDDDHFTPDTYDTYLNMELALPQGDSLEPRMARVTKRLKDANGIPIGTADDNPLLDTRMYEVEYLDGERASVQIALTIAALNDLQVMACDIQNAYLTADCWEKIWTYTGPEFGSEQGSIMFVRKALYGLKSSGTAFRAHLAETLHDIGFHPTRADPDVWRQPAKKADGEEYYKYILCYVDDLLAISEDAMKVLQGIQAVFKFKDDKIVCPEVYLGAQLNTMMVDGFDGWTMSSQKYVKAAIDNTEEVLARTDQRLPTKCGTPLKSGYRPELGTSPELKQDGLQRYQELIGMLRWAVELGRVDILLETALMSTHLALP